MPFVTQISIAVGSIAWLSARNGQQAVSNVAQQLWEETTFHVVDRVTEFIDIPHHLISDTAAFQELGVANLQDPEILTHYLWHQMQTYEDLFITAVGYEDGTVIGVGMEADGQLVVREKEPGQTQLHSYEIIGKGERGPWRQTYEFDARERPWYRQAVEAGKATWTDIYPNYSFPYLVISAVQPLYEPDTGELLGVTNATLSLHGIDRFLEELKVSPSAEIFIVERSGKLVASSTQENLYQESNQGAVDSLVRLSASQSSSARVRQAVDYLTQYFGDLEQIQGRELLYFSSPSEVNNSKPLGNLKVTPILIQGSPEIVQVTPFSDSYGLDWLVVVAVPEADFMHQIYANTRLTWRLSFGAFALAIGSGLLVSRWITRPLVKLNERTKAIAASQLSAEMAGAVAIGQGTVEARELAESFAQMVQHLQQSFGQMQQLNRELVESESRLQQLLEALPVGTGVHDSNGKLIYQNRVGRSLVGTDRIMEVPAEQLAVIFQTYRAGTDDLYPVEEMPVIRALKGESSYADDMELRQPERTVPIEIWASPIYDDRDRIVCAVAVFQDISDRKRTAEQLVYNALHDALTGLANRALLLQRLELALNRTRQTGDRSFAILFLDLDRFKTFNDSLGHLVGDRILMGTARKLERVVQAVDLVARLGGDEFVVLLEECQDVQSAIHVAEQILMAFQTPLILQEREVLVSTSIGIAFGTADYREATDLLRDADIALYRAKEQGRGGYEIFNADMHAQTLQQLQLEHHLQQAISRQELRVYYQPIFILGGKELFGFEALVRWVHPLEGMVPPERFIEVAEETGLIREIDMWVLQNSCEQMVRWHHQFPKYSHLKVSTNLSGREFQDNYLLENLVAVLQQTGLDASCLTLEITENISIENIDRTITLLKAIRDQGISVSIDDFGTGYSSLSYLYNLPVNYLKVDKSFVSNMRKNSKNYKIVQAIIGLSNQLQIDAIAEGIETQEQLQWLEEMGCELGQGYLMSKPKTPEEITDLLRQSQSVRSSAMALE
ncbi:EAL domain-containing protein [Roseofilum sp. BLCC_M143]|uniref:EAL domain-containing protein n=1 Tax=Roseofilum casamattae BLCC-M143 TaxID=3022442 RepID=A0ABT7BWM5_9CYAN|nr:EAL domain-containing protein [Roseofilum casamattae BLCC-M143]